MELRRHLGEMLKRLAEQKESWIEEGHLMPDHVQRKRNFVGQSFWARGYFVSTVRHDEATIREYIRNQEKEDRSLDQSSL
jgi:putative transposase